MTDKPETNKNENSTAPASQVGRLVMCEYSQGICQDEATILCNGEPMTIEEILDRLRTLEDVRVVIYDSPELNPSNYEHDDVCRLNIAMCEAWSIIESNI